MTVSTWIMHNDILTERLHEAEQQDTEKRVNIYTVCTHRQRNNNGATFDVYLVLDNRLLRIATDIKIKGIGLNRSREAVERVVSTVGYPMDRCNIENI